MEVHHHPDIHHDRRKFREYLIEFLMIFMAVTLGFFAEGLREHVSERQRGKEYALMLMKDVIKDTVELDQLLSAYKYYSSTIDTLEELRRQQKNKMNDFDFWYYSYPAFTAGRISFNDATMQQVKNSGNLRYFPSLKLKEKIGQYDNVVRNYSLRLEIELEWVPILNEFNNNLFDFDTRKMVEDKYHAGESMDSLRKANYHFVTRDSAMLSRFFNFCEYRKTNTWMARISDNIIPTMRVGRELIFMLKEEYRFSEK